MIESREWALPRNSGTTLASGQTNDQRHARRAVGRGSLPRLPYCLGNPFSTIRAKTFTTAGSDQPRQACLRKIQSPSPGIRAGR